MRAPISCQSKNCRHKMASSKDFRIDIAKLLQQWVISHQRKDLVALPPRHQLDLWRDIFQVHCLLMRRGKQMKDGALYMFIERKPKKSSYSCDDCDVGLCVAVLVSVFITPASRNIYVF